MNDHTGGCHLEHDTGIGNDPQPRPPAGEYKDDLVKELLHSLAPSHLGTLMAELGQPAFRARQLLDWLYLHPVENWEEMANLPRALRERLSQRFDLQGLELLERQISGDGTRKFLFELRDGGTIESVIIPMTDHVTFCLSTQIGCAMACSFCATARGGLVRNLEPGEIIQQVLRLQRDLADEPLPGGTGHPNVVFMGMGEPLDNFPALETSIGILLDPECLGFSRRRVRISTSGPGDGLHRLLASDLNVGLTISLGGSNDAERKAVMPVPGRTSVAEVLDLAERYGRRHGRKGTVAWVLIKDRTDHPDQARRLATLLRRRPFKVNLIPLNPLDDRDQTPPGQERILAFQRILVDEGIDTFIRASGGTDIAAACGQLRRRAARTASPKNAPPEGEGRQGNDS